MGAPALRGVPDSGGDDPGDAKRPVEAAPEHRELGRLNRFALALGAIAGLYLVLGVIAFLSGGFSLQLGADRDQRNGAAENGAHRGRDSRARGDRPARRHGNSRAGARCRAPLLARRRRVSDRLRAGPALLVARRTRALARARSESAAAGHRRAGHLRKHLPDSRGFQDRDDRAAVSAARGRHPGRRGPRRVSLVLAAPPDHGFLRAVRRLFSAAVPGERRVPRYAVRIAISSRGTQDCRWRGPWAASR